METHRFSVPADGDPSARQRRKQPRGPEYGANRPASQQEVRAAEAYFVKFPIELFDVIPGIGSARIDVPLDPVETEVPEDFQKWARRLRPGAPHVPKTPKQRAAVEPRSLDVAKAYYMDELGGTDYE